MAIVSLVLWVVAALGGFYLLGTWLSKGGMRQQATKATRFPPALIFGHFALAAVGLVLWIIYVITDSDVLAWIAFALIVCVALLGFTMFSRWLPGRRQMAAAGSVGGRAASGSGAEVPAEQNFPMAAVVGHGLLGAATLVLVLLTAAELFG